MLGPRFTAALAFASELHGSQVRKGTEIPYVSHLMTVAALVLENGGDEDQAIAAVLHDSVEDQGQFLTLKRIRERFGVRVAEIVDACTDADEYPKPPWDERKQAYIASIKQKSPEAILVSLSDKVHNARSILLDYKYVGENLWGRFKGGREGTLWYYRELVNAFRGRGPSRLFDEFEATVAEIERLAKEAAERNRAKQFYYYDDWRTAKLTCYRCGWTGTFEDGRTEYYEQLMDSSCPACEKHPMLAIVSYPTMEETEANWEKLSDIEKLHFSRKKELLNQFATTCLKAADQLPDIDAKKFSLEWDFLIDETKARVTVIRLNGKEIWRELASYEGYGRFEQVAEILKQKYGSRLCDLIPTPESETWLYGDKLTAQDHVDKVRDSIRKGTSFRGHD